VSIVNIITKNGTAADWVAANPVLKKAQQGYETDTGRSKYGDGSNPWNTLPYTDVISPKELSKSTFAALPDPTTIEPSVVFVTDKGANGKPIYSDGTDWRYFNDDTIVI
jgi:hypothetical protein